MEFSSGSDVTNADETHSSPKYLLYNAVEREKSFGRMKSTRIYAPLYQLPNGFPSFPEVSLVGNVSHSLEASEA